MKSGRGSCGSRPRRVGKWKRLRGFPTVIRRAGRKIGIPGLPTRMETSALANYGRRRRTSRSGGSIDGVGPCAKRCRRTSSASGSWPSTCAGTSRPRSRASSARCSRSLGYDLTDPRECIPEYRVDFGPNRSIKPIDWAFLQNGHPIFFVEAKEVGKKLANYDEQLADYFAKAPEARLGILTNGVQWRFFTDVVNPNIMDKEPFVKWDVLADEQPPFDFLTLLQKSQFNTRLIRTFAERKRRRTCWSPS